MSHRTSIIPITPTYYKIEGSAHWDLQAICVFVATGFFLDRDTYYNNQKVVPPATEFQRDAMGRMEKETPYFRWHYTPRAITFDQALEEFTALFESIIDEQVGNRKVILPLSGGLDSRTQAAALYHLGKKVHAYSYAFEGGYPETKIAAQMAQACEFPFENYTLPKGYLWSVLDELADINQCYSEFTHPRQMAVKKQLGALGEVFSLGHWGDVLFDRGVGQNITEADFPDYLFKKIVKKGGVALARDLWAAWGLEGDFDGYLKHRLLDLWERIEIDSLSAKMRAFKSLYWAPRWTSTNLSIFASEAPVTLPYYDNRMCEFICGIPEDYLADRKLQIAYIKQRHPALAKITWQAQKPYNLYSYKRNKPPFNLPYRIGNKLLRETKGLLGQKYVQRNWELQFLGPENKGKLESYLFGTALKDWIPQEIIHTYYGKFQKENAVTYSHAVSMLLTLAVKNERHGG